MNLNDAPAVLAKVRSALATPDLPDIGPQVRPGIKPVMQLRRDLDEALAGRPLSAATHELLVAAALIWHDHLDEAHELVQDGTSGDPAFIHGIIHRREPDYSNARYWFNRVGRHAAFPAIAARSRRFLEQADSRLASKLAPDGVWQPMSFISACEEAALKPTTDPEIRLLREVQRIEFDVLLDHICTHA